TETGGGSALYDAVHQAYTDLESQRKDLGDSAKYGIVVVSDGRDTRSKVSFTQLREKLSGSEGDPTGIQIHTIGIGKDARKGDLGNCVLVVGAGLSKSGVREGGGGIPDWDGLMSLMIDHLVDSGRCDEGMIFKLRDMLTQDPPRYTEIAEEFSANHNHDRDGYETFLRGLLMPDDLTDSATHKLILEMGFRGIVSFNFDNVFEHQSDRLHPIVYPELLEQIGQFQRGGFFAKIHGSIDRPATSLILTKTSYEQLRRHPNYGELLR